MHEDISKQGHCARIYRNLKDGKWIEIHGCMGLQQRRDEIKANPLGNPKAVEEIENILKNCPISSVYQHPYDPSKGNFIHYV